MSAQLDALVAEVAQVASVEQSAVTTLQFIDGQLAAIQAQLAAQSIDNATLDQLRTDLQNQTDALAAAIAASPQPPVVP